MIGEAAGAQVNSTVFAGNVLIGYQAGQRLGNASSSDIGIGNNAFLGNANGFSSSGNNIAIGQNVQGNNQTLNIEGLIVRPDRFILASIKNLKDIKSISKKNLKLLI